MARLKIFVGGIHGSGKGVLCRQLTNGLFGIYVSASELLNWSKKTKQVEDVLYNQRLLSELLVINTSKDANYVIDGHFALWNTQNRSEIVPLDTFAPIGLDAIVVAICKPDKLRERLQARDKVSYDIQALQELQEAEIKNAIKVSENLGIPLFIVDTSTNIEINEIINSIKSMSSYTRDNLLSPMLKVVVIRVDFTGLTNLEEFVNRIKTENLLKKSFDRMYLIPCQRMSVSFKPRGYEDGQLPYTEAQKSLLYRFTGCKIPGAKEVTLDIDADSITLAINCDESYVGSKKYSEFMAWIINELRVHDCYVSINRLGVRKIDTQVLKKEETIEDYFNDNYTVKNSWRLLPHRSKSILTELIDIDNVSLNVTQHIDYDNEERERLIFDVDAFIEGIALQDVLSQNNTAEILYRKMQDCMFDLFVSVASAKYLESCKQLKIERHGS